ncbi:MAG: TIGR00730 family Rossman fold protein [Anaerolineaceae bacterium]|nr:TIGR00730 family Rossman fold protein [Anaerolineaceae bacterium]
MIKRLCVFCGSSSGGRADYIQAARQLGHLLVENDITLVYGGGNVGLMGEIARTVLASGGEVIGVITRYLADKEVAFKEIQDLRLVDTMHERKALMADLSDGFIAMPGGLGTLEEFSEVLTWAQLGLHQKPCGLLNIDGYYNALCTFLDHMVSEQYLHSVHRSMVLCTSDASELLNLFQTYQAPQEDKAAWALKNNLHGGALPPQAE